MYKTETAIILPRKLSAYTIKLIAISAMLIDHIAWRFVPTASVTGAVMHIIGRLTFPIMCFLISEGFYYTKSRKKYITRMILFAFLSQLPYSYFHIGGIAFYQLNVMFTLLFGLIALCIWKSQLKQSTKMILIISLCTVSLFADWSYYGVLYCLTFCANRNNFNKQMKYFLIVSALLVITSIQHDITNLYTVGVLLVLPILKMYNGERGGYAWSKWIFYIFYPLHLIVIGML